MGCRADRAVVDRVSVEFADVLPGETEGGLKLQLDSSGNPLQLNVTPPGKEPPCAATVTV